MFVAISIEFIFNSFIFHHIFSTPPLEAVNDWWFNLWILSSDGQGKMWKGMACLAVGKEFFRSKILTFS